ncbi:hypothetical protein PM082_008727 [Marasmius tenuissimus]|nr:hypothetical protein PM082_008727 [Marasmius tenuissimus]
MPCMKGTEEADEAEEAGTWLTSEHFKGGWQVPYSHFEMIKLNGPPSANQGYLVGISAISWNAPSSVMLSKSELVVSH